MIKTRILDNIRSSVWFVPVIFLTGGVLLSLGTIAIDRHFEYQLIPRSITGGPDAAVPILSTIAASMVSMASIVLTITMVVVQLAMGQFSPRIVQRLLQDKPSQMAIGLFVATFAHAIVTLRDVTINGDGTGNVPGLALVTGYGLVFVSVTVLIIYVHHIGRALRVSALIELVGKQTRKLLDKVYPSSDEHAAHSADHLVVARKSGVITRIGHRRLVAEAAKAGCVLELLPAMGEFVPAGAALFRVHGEPIDLDATRVVGSVVLGLERTLDEDIAYGIRLLVDIAERSLSDSPYQDPTTAVQAIDRLHDVLHQLVIRPLPDGVHRGADGDVRLLVPVMDWEAYVHLAFDELRLVGAASLQVTRRLQAALLDLLSVAPAERTPAIEQQLALLAAAVEERVPDRRDVAMALEADRQGLGAAAGDGARHRIGSETGTSPPPVAA